MHILDNIEKRKLSIESQVEVLQHTVRGKLHTNRITTSENGSEQQQVLHTLYTTTK